MSNGLSLAAATRGLCAKISEALADAGTLGLGARVTSLRPNLLSATDAAVNVFMFQIMPNPALRNCDLPTRREAGDLAQRPVLALDLHFLLTFTGDEAELVPQRLMGVVLPALHAEPVLDRSELTRLVQSNSPSYLDQTDLAQQLELVRFGLGTMNLEELSKLWSVFFQTQYLLSVPLQASVLLLEAPVTPTPSLLVRSRGVFAGVADPPRISSLEPAFTRLRHDGTAATVQVRGSNFRGGTTTVRFGETEVAPTTLDGDVLTVAVPASLHAGVHRLSVLVSHAFEGRGVLKSFPLSSPPVPLAIVPRITSPSPISVRDGAIALQVEPVVGRAQRVRVLIERRTPGLERRALNWAAPPPARDGASAETFGVLNVRLPDELPTGRYALQVEVDGITSDLDRSFDELPFLEAP